MLKSNCKYVPVDGTVPAQNICNIHKGSLTGEVTGKKCNAHCKLKFSKIGLTTPTFLCYEMEVASLVDK